MAEGGLLRWKVQKIEGPPAADYSCIHQPLPVLPPGKYWSFDKEKREWCVTSSDPKHPSVAQDHSEDKKTTKKEEEGKIPEEWLKYTDGKKRDVDFNEEYTTKDEAQMQAIISNLRRTSPSTELLPPPEEGVDYALHVVVPTDTIQGICLSYKISARELKKVNKFSGETLLASPPCLVIPLSKIHLDAGKIRMQDKTSREFKIQAFLARLPEFRASEARAYLDLSNWELDDAVKDAKADKAWEKQQIQHEKEKKLETTKQEEEKVEGESWVKEWKVDKVYSSLSKKEKETKQKQLDQRLEAFEAVFLGDLNLAMSSFRSKMTSAWNPSTSNGSNLEMSTLKTSLLCDDWLDSENGDGCGRF